MVETDDVVGFDVDTVGLTVGDEEGADVVIILSPHCVSSNGRQYCHLFFFFFSQLLA